MKQLAIISGKGGTGKTSIAAAFAAIAKKSVTADCDVDAADLHLLLSPHTDCVHELAGGLKSVIDLKICTECDLCRELCRFEAIDEHFVIDPFRCEGCGVCADHCPVQAVSMNRQKAGDWFESTTRFGPMIHARLGIAQENSGKLVASVRQRAIEIAREKGIDLIITDGPPGIGCPVISSITGTDMVLAVTEPTPSGIHDLKRVLELARHFKVPAAICVNKADLHLEHSEAVAAFSDGLGVKFLGGIPFDHTITGAMMAGKTVPEFGESKALSAIEKIWNEVKTLLAENG